MVIASLTILFKLKLHLNCLHQGACPICLAGWKPEDRPCGVSWKCRMDDKLCLLRVIEFIVLLLVCLTGLAELRDNYSMLYYIHRLSTYRIISWWFQFDFTCLCSVLVLSCNHVLHVDCFWKMLEPQFVSLVPSGIEWSVFLLPDQAFHGSAIVLCLGPVTKWGLDTCGPAMSCHDILVQCVCCVLCHLSFFFVPSWFTIIRYQQKSRFEACWSCHPMASPLLSKDHCRRLWRVARPKAFGGP